MKETVKTTKEIKFGALKGEEWGMLLNKLANTPTANVRANHLRKVVKAMNEASKQIMAKYEAEVLSVFAKKTEDGKLFRPPGQPNAYEIIEEKQAEFQTALHEFGERTIEVDLGWRPLTPDTLTDIKVTAAELELLGEWYTDENGPGMPPQLHALNRES